MKRNNKVTQLVLLGLFTAILLVMSWTPLGYLKIGGFEITLNIIPVAIAAITLGPVGGAVTGVVFGLTSFFQCIGIGGLSQLGEILFSINPFYCFIVCFLPRVLDGLIIGFLHNILKKHMSDKICCFITGFAAAFFNTLLFMSTLILFYGKSEYLQGLIAGKNIIVFVCAFVGFNAVFEMLASTIVSGAVGTALCKSGVVKTNN